MFVLVGDILHVVSLKNIFSPITQNIMLSASLELQANGKNTFSFCVIIIIIKIRKILSHTFNNTTGKRS